MESRIRALYKIEPDLEGPALARRIVADELSELVSDRVLEDVQLMVSELVTNGIVHGAAQSDPVMLDLYLNGHIRCCVHDHGARFATRVRTDRGSDGAGGWGLQVVEQLSDLWGMQCSPQRTEVWFVREFA